MVSRSTIQRATADSFNILTTIPHNPAKITRILPVRFNSCLMRFFRSCGVGKPAHKKFFRLFPANKASPATKRRIITVLYTSGATVANFQRGKTKANAKKAHKPTKARIFTNDKRSFP